MIRWALRNVDHWGCLTALVVFTVLGTMLVVWIASKVNG